MYSSMLSICSSTPGCQEKNDLFSAKFFLFSLIFLSFPHFSPYQSQNITDTFRRYLCHSITIIPNHFGFLTPTFTPPYPTRGLVSKQQNQCPLQCWNFLVAEILTRFMPILGRSSAAPKVQGGTGYLGWGYFRKFANFFISCRSCPSQTKTPHGQ